eukprot:TRINITY_DN1189_c0_g1_i2.p1 TRINITY_DN1189_c0_g1~~TRINITY_DN1189_c0_g1_i2.p1  ORF type:complete len:214 (+),score=46.62 TRINITY_DN1189_c0_g1_i2:173-814(+)
MSTTQDGSDPFERKFDFFSVEPSARKRSSDWENVIEPSSSMEISSGDTYNFQSQTVPAAESTEFVITPVERSSTQKFIELMQHAQIQAASWEHVSQLLEWRLAERLHELEWKELIQKQASVDATAGCLQAQMGYNRGKNRYGNILPHDGTRFRLVCMPEDEGSDYINASYIGTLTDTAGRAAFVACQAPLFRTFGDWYRMIWCGTFFGLCMPG